MKIIENKDFQLTRHVDDIVLAISGDPESLLFLLNLAPIDKERAKDELLKITYRKIQRLVLSQQGFGKSKNTVNGLIKELSALTNYEKILDHEKKSEELFEILKQIRIEKETVTIEDQTSKAIPGKLSGTEDNQFINIKEIEKKGLPDAHRNDQ